MSSTKTPSSGRERKEGRVTPRTAGLLRSGEDQGNGYLGEVCAGHGVREYEGTAEQKLP